MGEVGTAISCMSGLLPVSYVNNCLEDIKVVLEDLQDFTMVTIGEEGVGMMIVEVAIMATEGIGMIGGIGTMTGVDIAGAATRTGTLDVTMIDMEEIIEAPGKIDLVAILLQRGGLALLNGMQRLEGNDAMYSRKTNVITVIEYKTTIKQ